MKKLRIALSFLLLFVFTFSGCSTEIDDASVTVTGDLAYYAAMDDDTRKETCEGQFLDVSGTVTNVLSNIGTIYLGNYSSDKIRFNCDFNNADDVANIQEGDYITIRGKCSSCIGTSVYLKNCQITETITPTESETTQSTTAPTETTAPPTDETVAPTTAPTTAPTIPPTVAPTTPATEPPHSHNYSAATCTNPQTCSCGATIGNAAGHTYSGGKCTICGTTDPNFTSEVMVWIPTKGGTKYHTYAGCSNMDDPIYVTLSEAEAQGFTACKRCH